MSIEDDVMAELRAMDHTAKLFILEMSRRQAARHPDIAPRPVLTLVASNLRGRLLLGGAGGIKDGLHAPLSAAPKKIK